MYFSSSEGRISEGSNNLSAGRIEYFFSQSILIGNDYKEVKMAKVKWFQEHTVRNADDRFLDPVTIWSHDLYKPASFMPIEKIKEVCITCEILIDGE